MTPGASPSSSLALDSLEVLQRAGYAAYLVGGCVRDRLLGREPTDFDIATSAHPDVLLRLFPGAVEVGASFGVVLRRQGDAQVQIATFRREGNYQDGRHPGFVEYVADPREDAARRDFTFNAMFEDPRRQQLLDFFGGQSDLAARQIRAVGNPATRFEEDHLRMLRAVRFAARLNFTIEARTRQAIIEQASRIHRISAERIRDELSRILTEGAPRRGLELLDEVGLLAEVLPEAKAMQGVEQPPDFHPEGDVWTHTMLMLDLLESPSLTLALGVLFHDIGKPETQTVTDRIRFNGHVEAGEKIARRVMNRLRYSSEEIDQVVALVANHMKFIHLRDMRQSTLKRFLRLPHFEEHLQLHRADCLSSHRKLGNYDFAREMRETLGEDQLRPAPLLRGEDLVAEGFRPGPVFREILDGVETRQLEGVSTTREEALEWVRNHFKDRL
jgi:putative nucleotidyltransferase with HDIG domain